MDPLKFLQENPTPSELPFPEEEFQGRIAKVRKLMGDGRNRRVCWSRIFPTCTT